MPSFEPLSKKEVSDILEDKHRGRPKSQREQVLEMFMEQLRPLEIGEGLVIKIEKNENRQTVKNRLKRAASRLGYKIEFIRSRGVIRIYRTA